METVNDIITRVRYNTQVMKDNTRYGVTPQEVRGSCSTVLEGIQSIETAVNEVDRMLRELSSTLEESDPATASRIHIIAGKISLG